MAKSKGTLHKIKQGPNKGDTIRKKTAKKGPKQQGTPWYPVSVAKDVGKKNTSKVAKKSKKK